MALYNFIKNVRNKTNKLFTRKPKSKSKSKPKSKSKLEVVSQKKNVTLIYIIIYYSYNIY